MPKFIEQIKAKEKITITDYNMTRFSITMNEALDFILESTLTGKGSEIFVPKLRAYSIQDLKQTLIELIRNTGEKKIPIRPGEKMHETLINNDEMRYTWEWNGKYVIFNPIKSEHEIKKEHPKIKKVENLNRYSSDLVAKIPKNELKRIISKSGLLEPQTSLENEK